MPKGSGKPIPRVEIKLDISSGQAEALLKKLKLRFEKNMERHKGFEWAKVQAKLETQPEKLSSLHAMETTGGEPDVVGYDEKTGEYIFYDCSEQSPSRRSICYDGKGERERIKKGVHPGGNAVDLAEAMGIELLDEDQYRQLQMLGEFDTKTESWLKTPVEIRDLGGAIYGNRRYNRVFVGHNSAPSFYAGRGFRGSLRV
ncbi:MAG: DUF4256 domain-containing protein [Anaerolineales bacterium]|jgi:hypothetical protein